MAFSPYRLEASSLMFKLAQSCTFSGLPTLNDLFHMLLDTLMSCTILTESIIGGIFITKPQFSQEVLRTGISNAVQKRLWIYASKYRCVYIYGKLYRELLYATNTIFVTPFWLFFNNFLLLHVFEYTIMIWGYYVHVHAGDGLEVRDGLVTETVTAVAGFWCQKCLEAWKRVFLPLWPKSERSVMPTSVSQAGNSLSSKSKALQKACFKNNCLGFFKFVRLSSISNMFVTVNSI